MISVDAADSARMRETNDSAYRAWMKSLDAETRDAIRSLHEIRPAWNWVALLYPTLWALAVALMTRYPVLPVRLAGYVVIGISIHAMGVLMHDCIHGSMFRRPRLDRWIGLLLGAPALLSVSAYRAIHMPHHRHNRTERDPDEFTNLTTNRRALAVLFFYVLLFIGLLPYALLHVPISGYAHGSVKEKRAILIDYTLLAGIYGAVFVGLALTDHVGIILHCWAIPLVWTMFAGNVRSWAEHMLTAPGHPLTESRTVTSNRVYSFLCCNINYHLEHHLFPAVPWYHLPKLHAVLQGEYRKAGSFIYRSYLRFLWDAMRVGVFGYAPDSTTKSLSY
ncbi:MAG: fatty acid desaturase [Candidatus Poribacteria bacterium]|nr:fatty acid desaturase [Candidatus Poribacteria bacterium]